MPDVLFVNKCCFRARATVLSCYMLAMRSALVLISLSKINAVIFATHVIYHILFAAHVIK